jgi:3-oxoacyl-[acyl-carrier protein] reductase
MTLDGKTALVTGASRGIDRATPLALAGAGARVAIHYGQSESDAESVVAGIRAHGGLADGGRDYSPTGRDSAFVPPGQPVPRM